MYLWQTNTLYWNNLSLNKTYGTTKKNNYLSGHLQTNPCPCPAGVSKGGCIKLITESATSRMFVVPSRRVYKRGNSVPSANFNVTELLFYQTRWFSKLGLKNSWHIGKIFCKLERVMKGIWLLSKATFKLFTRYLRFTMCNRLKLPFGFVWVFLNWFLITVK